MEIKLRAEAVVDLDAASDTTAYTFKAPAAGYLKISELVGRFEEAVAAGGFSSAAGVLSVVVAGTEVATWSTGVAATARSIGDGIIGANFTSALTAPDDAVEFASGDAITLKTKTQGTGGTVTGTIRVWLPLYLNA